MPFSNSEARYYASHSRSTEPGPFGEFLAGCGAQANEVVRAVPGLVLHSLFVERRGIQLPAARDDVETRTVHEIVRRILDREAGH